MNRPEHPGTVLSDRVVTRESPARTLPRAAQRPARSRKPRNPFFPNEQRSLFGEILDWMFAPLMLLWPLSVAVTFVVARSLADAPFDQALIDRTSTLREQMMIVDSSRRSALLQTVEKLALLNDGESLRLQIVDSDGRTLAGDTDLPRPDLYDFPSPGQTKLRNAVWHGTDIRIAYTYAMQPDPNQQPMLIQVAETFDTRNALASEIIRGVLFPQFLILPLALALVWFGLSRGLAPLKLLQENIRKRRPDDLSPIDAKLAPEELSPLVNAFNDLLKRQAQTLAAQTRFIADAAHQLKTPLAGLRTQSELALRETNPGELRKSLEQLAGSAERSAHMVSQLLALARTENLRDAIRLEPLELAPLVRAILGDYYAESLSKQIDLGYGGDDDAARINGHPILLRELVVNLIDNAVRYTPAGGVVTVRVSSTDDQVLLDVEDDGVGIAPAERELVFERFYRVLGGTAEGSGLGLSIVKEIALQHRASISLADGLLWPAHRGAGTGVRITLRFPKLADRIP